MSPPATNGRCRRGGIDPGEDPLASARRELFEETNVQRADLLGQAKHWLTYDLPADIAQQAWKGRYRGQAQLWFAFRLGGEESEIDVLAPGGGLHKPEFDAWRWVDLAVTPTLIIPFKRPVYEAVAKMFADFSKPA